MSRRLDEDDTDSEVMSEDGGESSHESASATILGKLAGHGVPGELLRRKQEGFVEYAQQHPEQLGLLLKVMLPDADAIYQASASDEAKEKQTLLWECQEALNWLEWGAFGSEPRSALERLKQQLGGVTGVCGAVWGASDIAYRCHTCGHDPTCAICVACFRDGDHTDHDYQMIRTTGGCCDCGDVTAWKESGFCSRHRGPGRVPPLPNDLTEAIRPVLQAALVEWKNRLLVASAQATTRPRPWKSMTPEEKIVSRLSISVIVMLIEYCNFSESMLSFVAEHVSRKDIDLLDTLMTTECFLSRSVTSKLHELLYKLLGDPQFKYRFAQDFIARYPKYLHDTMFETSSSSRRRDFEFGTILRTFSVQIFTVPTLTPRLVVESKLLELLFGILKEFFLYCIGEDGRFMVSQQPVQDRAYMHAMDDLKYVMSHLKVAQYVIHEHPQLCRTWLQFLAFVQGMYPQKRITGIHIEEESEDGISAYLLESHMAKLHPLFVAGTALLRADVDGDGWSYYPKTMPGNLVSGKVENQDAYESVDGVPLTKALVWLISECLTVLDSWLAVDASRDSARPSTVMQPLRQSRRLLPRGRYAVRAASALRAVRQSLDVGGFILSAATTEDGSETPSEAAESYQEATDMEVCGSEDTSSSDMGNDWWMGSEEAYGSGFSLLLGQEKWPGFKFEVRRQEVSLHIPLHRMLALLFQRALEEYQVKRNLTGGASSFQESNFLLQLIPEAFRVPGYAALLMEHPLRIQVLCAQVQAGMWRRNGHTVVGLCDIYRSVQWCEASLELDLFLLQYCAAMAPAEDFVNTVVKRFDLEEYFTLFLWKPDEYDAFLAQELLAFLVKIVAERGFCGLSPVGALRRELVQRLAIGDASRSVLMSSLPPRLQDNKHLQEVLEDVAVHQKAQGMQQGKYVLLEKSWRELDLYHPRWTPRELQSAEERYLRICRSSALFSQAPKWRDCYLPLRNLANIATSAKVHEMLRSVFFHSAFSPNLFESRAPENLLFTALHLLSLALDICATFHKAENSMTSDVPPESDERPPLLIHAPQDIYVGVPPSDKQSTLSLLVLLMKKYATTEGEQFFETSQCNAGSFIKNLLKRFAELDRQCMYVIETLAPEILHRVSTRPSPSEKAQVELSMVERKKALARERKAAMMAKMKAAQEKFIASLQPSEQAEPKQSIAEGKRPLDSDETCALCRDRSSSSPLCILVLVQRSRLLALAQRPVPSWDNASRIADDTPSLDKDTATALTRGDGPDRVENRDDFLELLRGELPSFLSSRFSSSSSSRRVADNSQSEETDDSFDADEDDSDILTDSPWWERLPARHSEAEADRSVYTVLADYLAAISRGRDEVPAPEVEAPRDNAARMRRLARNSMESRVYDSIGVNDFIGLHLSACGHAAHQECVERYHSSVLQRHYSRSLFEGVQIVDPDLGEFLCPVCRRLSNCTLPIVDGGSVRRLSKCEIRSQDSTLTNLALGDIPASREALNSFGLEKAFGVLYTAEELMGKPGFRSSLLKKSSHNRALDAVAVRLCGLFYPDKDHARILRDGKAFQALFLWDVLRYSIMAAELASRTKNVILGHQDAMNRLVVLEEAAEASKGSVLPLMFLAAKSSICQSRQAILLRTRGLQLMVGSICCGVSRDLLPEKGLKGHLKGADSADMQFWRRAADPVLSHDPFSSLIWVLFTLPTPIPSDEHGPITCLVHLFYLVCVVQCLASVGTVLASDLNSEKTGPFLSTLNACLTGTCIYMPSSSQTGATVDDIRRLTLPYLRRCALLQATCCKTPWPITGSNSWDISSVHSLLQREHLTRLKPVDSETFELVEAGELEKRFQIPALASILADQGVQITVLKWCEHLRKESESRTFPCVPRPVRATPFQLMRLPHLFEDLLQRYVKERCTRCNTVPEKPALCLLCGALCCGSGPSGCCSVSLQSECYRHAIACGGGVGVYLMLRKINVLLVRRERLAIWGSPYLDKFGEEDQELRRGKPLFLSAERYAALTAMVASHSLDYSSSVLSQSTRDGLF